MGAKIKKEEDDNPEKHLDNEVEMSSSPEGNSVFDALVESPRGLRSYADALGGSPDATVPLASPVRLKTPQP